MGGFGLQAVLRSLLLDAPLAAALLPISGVAFILYTFYMVTDPATTPTSPAGQVVFGASVATLYGLLLLTHVVFGLFFALTLVCLGRGALLYAVARQVPQRALARARAAAPRRATTLLGAPEP